MKYILVPLLFCASYLSAIESNILVNCSFNSDGIGGELNWSRRSMTESLIERLYAGEYNKEVRLKERLSI